jgi:hypothetical protein
MSEGDAAQFGPFSGGGLMSRAEPIRGVNLVIISAIIGFLEKSRQNEASIGSSCDRHCLGVLCLSSHHLCSVDG